MSELNDAIGDLIRERGEYGTTTGRARRCGWFDAVMIRYAVRVNGLTGLAMTLLDVLDALEDIRYVWPMSTAERGWSIFRRFERLRECKPVYAELSGWKEDTTEVKDVTDLPPKPRLIGLSRGASGLSYSDCFSWTKARSNHASTSNISII